MYRQPRITLGPLPERVEFSDDDDYDLPGVQTEETYEPNILLRSYVD